METPTFSINFRAVKRVLYVMLAAFLVVSGLPLITGRASAATNQLGSRSIQMSDSSISGTSITTQPGSGTNVSYDVSVTLADPAESMVIDFCSNDPIIGDSCTAPSDMDVSGAAIGTTAVSGQINTTNHWTVDVSSSTVNSIQRIKLHNDGVGADDALAGVQSFVITGIKNPSALGSFYARMYTYTHADYGATGGTAYSSATAPGTYIDYGGFALSTTRTITITARVQETLTFCVTAVSPNDWANTTPSNGSGTEGDCSAGEVGAAANAPAVTLGHGSGSTKVLDANTVDYAQASNAFTGTGTIPANAPIFSQLSTNATHGAVINLHNSNTSCGGLSADGGTSCPIPPLDQATGNACVSTPAGSAESACPMTAGVAAFGLFVNTFIPTTHNPSPSVGTITPSPTYYNSTHCGVDGDFPNGDQGNICPAGDQNPDHTWYGMDSQLTVNNGGKPATNAGNVKSTFGSTVASSTAPVYHFDNIYDFAATAALTTPAGIYTANLSLIATGTF